MSEGEVTRRAFATERSQLTNLTRVGSNCQANGASALLLGGRDDVSGLLDLISV